MIRSNLSNYLSTLLESVLSSPGWFLSESLKDVFVPCLLSLVLGVLFRNVFPKPLWGVLWGALLIYFLGGLAQEGFRILWSESASSTCLLYGLLLLGLFLGCAFWGLHLQPKNWIHWLTVPALFAVSFVGNALYFGERVIDCWGVVSHFNLEPSENKFHIDYEIHTEFHIESGNVEVRFFVKKDSIGYKFGYFPEVHPDSCQWQPLTEKQRDLIQKLNQASAAFEPVYMTSFYHEHFSSQLIFEDFNRGQGRALLFYDAKFNEVQDAVALENLQIDLLETVDPSGKYVPMVRKAAEAATRK